MLMFKNSADQMFFKPLEPF